MPQLITTELVAKTVKSLQGAPLKVSEDLIKQFGRSYFTDFLAVAYGHMLIETFLMRTPQTITRMVGSLPIDLQRKLVIEEAPIDVVVWSADGVASTIQVKVTELTLKQARQVFTSTGRYTKLQEEFYLRWAHASDEERRRLEAIASSQSGPGDPTQEQPNV